MQRYMHAFIHEFESKSYQSGNIKWILYEFDTFLINNSYDKEYITEDIFNKWYVYNRGLSSQTIFIKARVIKSFSFFLSRIGIESYAPRIGKAKQSEYIPYIFTDIEINNIFKALDSLRLRIRQKRSILFCVPAIIRLLYSTALRINEALSLKNKDVDFKNHTILLTKTKNNHQRYAPINHSMEVVLKQYISYRDRITIPNISAPDNYFFVSPLGKPCHKDEVALWFQQALRLAGIPYKGQYEGPRVHDIRYTSCSHSLIKMIKSGKDIYCCLPILSKFMGHTSVTSTERYLRLTQNMYPDIIKMDRSVTDDINFIIKNSILMKEDGTI